MSEKKSVISPIDADFDDVVSAVLGGDNRKSPKDIGAPSHAGLIKELTTPKGWGVPVRKIVNQTGIRLDAEHYDPIVAENDKELKALGVDLEPLSNFAEVRLPSMFTRIWAKDRDHGVPYLNATDLMSYFSLGVPAQERYLSHASNVKMDPLIVKSGMILVTCSGTIGRVFDVPNALDGWAGTHDIVRIVPHDPEMRGYLRAYLTSRFAQIQILSHTHGGQIDHVTDEQVASCLIPAIDPASIKRISDLANRADKMRNDSIKLMGDALKDLSGVLKHD